jgi:secreted PhoX family phosphatase
MARRGTFTAVLLLLLVLAAAVCVTAREFGDFPLGRQLLKKGDDDNDKGKGKGKGKGKDREENGNSGNGNGSGGGHDHDDDDDDEDEDHGDDVTTLSSRYKVIVRSGDICPGCGPDGTDLPWGKAFQSDNKTPIYEIRAGAADKTRPVVSNNPDFFSLIKTGGRNVKAFVQFESPSPSALYLANLEADAKGELNWTTFRSIDTSEWGGLQGTCAGSVSPWNTHLGSEENCPNARALEAGYSLPDSTPLGSVSTYSGILPMMRYFGVYPNDLTAAVYKKFYNPYNYGHIWEVSVNSKGQEKLVKIFNLPRVSSEMAYVMPDKKTVYICDDASNGAFFKMVYDRAGDLTSVGTLYALKALQRPDTVGQVRGNFKVTWIKMGRATHAEVYAARNLRFSQLFESETPNPLPTDAAALAACKAAGQCKGGCPTAGFREIQSDLGRECLRVRPGKENIAAFLESRRYAPYVGATSEFSKWEGFTFDPKQRKIYTAISYQRSGMEDFANNGVPSLSRDQGGNNDVRLKFENCGGVYIMDVDSKYSAINLYTKDALTGKTLNPEAPVNDYICDENRIANPDNVNFIKDHATLVIGEDGDGHNANSAWAYNVNTDELTPILRSPAGGEVTGNFYWHAINVQGFSYQGIVVQHPSAPVTAPVGYMGPFKLKKGQEIKFTPVAKR